MDKIIISLVFILNIVLINSCQKKHEEIFYNNVIIEEYTNTNIYEYTPSTGGVIGYIYANEIEYNIGYIQFIYEDNKISGILIIATAYGIVGYFEILNEIPKIIDNKLVFENNSDTIIDLESGIPKEIIINDMIIRNKHIEWY